MILTPCGAEVCPHSRMCNTPVGNSLGSGKTGFAILCVTSCYAIRPLDLMLRIPPHLIDGFTLSGTTLEVQAIYSVTRLTYPECGIVSFRQRYSPMGMLRITTSRQRSAQTNIIRSRNSP